MNHNLGFPLLALILLSGYVQWQAEAQVPFPGKCPKVKVMNTFNVSAYLGTWYEHSKYPFEFEMGQKCIYAHYEVIDNSTISVDNGGLNRVTDYPETITGKGTVIAPAQLAVSFSPNQNVTTPNYLVLGTDYESYSVVYSCANVTVASIKFAWILTRERHPSNVTIATAQKILDDNHTLVLSYADQIDDKVISQFYKLTELKRLGLHSSMITDSSLLQLMINCPKLSTLRMEGCHKVSDNLLYSIITLVRKDIQSGKNQRELPFKLFLWECESVKETLFFRNIIETNSDVVDVIFGYSKLSKWFDEELDFIQETIWLKTTRFEL